MDRGRGRVSARHGDDLAARILFCCIGLRPEGSGRQAATRVDPFRLVAWRASLNACLEPSPVMTVVDPHAARAAMRAGRLACPQSDCEGVLRVWSRARARPVLMGGGRTVVVRPDRARCRACGVTQVLLVASCLPRRAYGVEVVGAALSAAAEGAGHRRVAADVGVPAGTARAWIRAVARNAPALTGVAVRVARALGADTQACWTSGLTAPGPVRAALQALGCAARALGASSTARAGLSDAAGPITGIDYLALLAGRHREQLYRRLRLSDPTDAAATAPPWHQVAMITGGRLLTRALPG